MTLFKSVLLAGLLASTFVALPARAVELPADVHIVFDLLYGDGGMRVGQADERWHLAAGHYELQTEIVPIIGPHIRYVSKGRVTSGGLVPDSFAEFRNAETEPRLRSDFDWDAMSVKYGKPDDPHTSPLERGAQDINAVAFQLSWLGDKAPGTMQIATGKKVARYTFAASARQQASINGRNVSAQPWRSDEGNNRTEIWVARQLGNLPVRVIRVDDDKQLQLVARDVQVGPAKQPLPSPLN